MIAYLQGRLVRTYDTSLILLAGDVGYEVFCPRGTLDHAIANPDALALEILTVYKQESITLFGFHTLESLKLFETLLTVQGVGGKMALSLLSALAPQHLIDAIYQQDHLPLTQADGVGPKLAQRITRELKDKIKKLGTLSEAPLSPTSGSAHPAFEDAAQALKALGYKPSEVSAALKSVQQEGSPETPTANQLITLALQKLSKS